MAKENNFELSKMLLLMERMNQPLTESEISEINENIKEDTGVGRINYSDLNDFLNTVELNNKFVGLTYVQGYPTDKIYPERDDFENKLKNEYPNIKTDDRVRGKLDTLLQNPEVKNPTGRAYLGYRSMANTGIQGIMKVTNYVFNWGGSDALNKFYEKQRIETAELRRKYGFGEEDSFYDADDWHRRVDSKGNSLYKGLSANPVSTDNRKTANGNYVSSTYGQVINPEHALYGDTDSEGNPRFTTRPDGSQYQKTAFKVGLRDVKKQWSRYFLIDNNGEMDIVSKDIANIFSKAKVTSSLRNKITNDMAKDEIEFINAMSDLQFKHDNQIKTFITNNILCIVATGKDRRTGEKTSYRWVNPNLSIDKLDINKNEFDNFARLETAEITKETAI